MARLIELAVVGIALFFAWQGASAVNHFTSPTWIETLSQGGGLRTYSLFLFTRMQIIMIVASGSLVLMALLPEERQTDQFVGITVIAVLAWAGLGWWEGRQMAADAPKLVAHIAYSTAATIVAITGVIRLVLSASPAQKKSG